MKSRIERDLEMEEGDESGELSPLRSPSSPASPDRQKKNERNKRDGTRETGNERERGMREPELGND